MISERAARVPFRAASLALGAVLSLASLQVSAQEARRDPSQPSYRIAPSDVLEIVVWKEPDLTREVTVRVDGMITVPLIGELQAAGQAPRKLSEDIAKALERFIGNPQVTVIVAQAASSRFYVVGQVESSGEFELSGRTTVLQGLALAGGFKEYAKLKDIVVIQRDGTVIPFNFERVAEGKDATQNVPLSPGDTIVVP